jgi:WD40 repeat-containing protein SMU1
MSQSVGVCSEDVVRVVLQFLRENKLFSSVAALQEEAAVCCNTVESVEAFSNNIRVGKWDAVLKDIAGMRLPVPLLGQLYEQMCLELIERRELDLARALLRSTAPLSKWLREQHYERYMKLELLIQRPSFDADEVYERGSSKETRREDLSDALLQEVKLAPPARLLSLLGQALQLQQQQGLLPPGGQLDVFCDTRAAAGRAHRLKRSGNSADMVPARCV